MITDCSLSPRSLVIIFIMQLMREMGLKSFSVVGLVTLGTRVMELFMACRSTIPLKKSIQTSYISFLIMCQHFLINRSLNPSGPGTLSPGIVLTIMSMSSLVKGSAILCKSCSCTSCCKVKCICG
jgi:hypothetical protein